MLTPAFELRQDKDFLTVIIKAPFAKVSPTQFCLLPKTCTFIRGRKIFVIQTVRFLISLSFVMVVMQQGYGNGTLIAHREHQRKKNFIMTFFK